MSKKTPSEHICVVIFCDGQYGDLDFEKNFIFDEDSRSYIINFFTERSE